jgi:type I site-specific restriction endonuclease
MAELLNEDETKARLITPAFHESGWSEEHIRPKRHFADGRIGVSGDRTERLGHKRYGNVLCSCY